MQDSKWQKPMWDGYILQGANHMAFWKGKLYKRFSFLLSLLFSTFFPPFLLFFISLFGKIALSCCAVMSLWKWSESKSHSVESDSVTPWTVAHQAPLSLGFSRQEYWRALPLPSPGDLPDPGIKPGSPPLQADSLSTEPPGKLMLVYLFKSKLQTSWIITP